MGKRSAVAIAITFATLVATTGVAGAPWLRGLAANIVESNDVKVCPDEITISSHWESQTFQFPPSFNTGAMPGDPPPTGTIPRPDTPITVPDTVELFASSADAILGANSVATVSIPLTLTTRADGTPSGVYHIFDGRGTVATPVGFRTPGVSKLYVRYVESGTFAAQELIVGGPSTGGGSYNCAPTTTPLAFNVSLYRDRVLIPATYPSLVWFDPAGVDTSTVKVAANNGAPTSARYLGTFFGKAFFSLRFADAGVNCASTSIKLTANGTSGQSFEGTRPVRPIGC